MSNTNLDLAHRWFEEVWNQRRADTIDELIMDGGVGHLRTGDAVGPDAFKTRVYQPFLQAFPDLQVVVEDTIADGDRVVVRWQLRATHSGDGLGIAPSGRPVSVTGITWIRYRDGKMAEGWDCWNQDGLLAQLRQAAAAPAGDNSLIVV